MGKFVPQARIMLLASYLIVVFIATAVGNQLDVLEFETSEDLIEQFIEKRSSPWELSSEEISEEEKLDPEPTSTAGQPTELQARTSSAPISEDGTPETPISISDRSTANQDEDLKNQGGFPANNNYNDFAYTNTAGNHPVDGGKPINTKNPTTFTSQVQSQDYAFHNHEGEMNGGFYTFVSNSGGYSTSAGSGAIPLNNLASGHGHPHVPRTDPNWGVQHFHFPNGPHPFQDIFRQMSNPLMNNPYIIPMTYPQMYLPPQMPMPYSQINQPNQMPNNQFNPPHQVPHSQVTQFQQKPATETKHPKQQNQVDSSKDESTEAPTDGRIG